MKAWRSWHLAWFAQAALIILPVLVLSAVALHDLREDRTAIEQEAKQRAKSLVSDAARRLGEQIAALLAGGHKNGVLTEGEIVAGQFRAMPDYPRFPAPANWPRMLSPREAQLWSAVQAGAFDRPGSEAVKTALASLMGAGVSAPLQANADLRSLIDEELQSSPSAFISRAVGIANKYPAEVTESGASVADLALLSALRRAAQSGLQPELANALQNQLSVRPSFLSTELLNSAGRGNASARLRDMWLKQESRRATTREMIRSFYLQATAKATSGFPLSFSPAVVIYRSPALILALCARTAAGWRVTFVPADLLHRSLHPDLPGYMGASLIVGGERQELGTHHAAKPAVLAAASAAFKFDAQYPFQLALDLRDPDALYRPYRRRRLLTQWLIVTAAAAAMLGLWRLWNTYRQQTLLNQIKSNLVSGVSHELRAPIAAVRLMAESLGAGRIETAEKQKDYYRLIVRECSRLSSLVENVLDYSRIDQGRKQYRFEPLDALALVRHTVMLMEPCAAEREVRLRFVEPTPDAAALQPAWDSEAIQQSMINLIDNAIKHSPAGAEVRVELEPLSALVRLWVIDAGPGIPAEEQRKIFDLFYRTGSELRRETEGVGIGLSIVKHIAEAHGGQVLVQSTVGQGSRFALELPR